jgi:hypothetical protein
MSHIREIGGYPDPDGDSDRQCSQGHQKGAEDHGNDPIFLFDRRCGIPVFAGKKFLYVNFPESRYGCVQQKEKDAHEDENRKNSVCKEKGPDN